MRIYDFAVGGLPLSLRKLVKFELDGGKQQILSVGGTKLLILTSSPRGDPCLFGCLLLSESFFGCKGPLQTKKSNQMNSELMSLRFPAPIQWVLNYV